MNQLQLFESGVDISMKPLSRRTDPVQSHVAAEQIIPKLNSLQSAFIQGLRMLPPSATAREVAELVKSAGGANCEVETIRKRSGELEDMGLIKPTGVRLCRVTGKLAEAFEVTK